MTKGATVLREEMDIPADILGNLDQLFDFLVKSWPPN